MSEINEALRELDALVTILTSDVKIAVREAAGADQREGRNLVRAIFSYVEGTVFRLKQLAYATELEGGSGLTQGELAMLIEESYEVTSDGVVLRKSARIPFLGNVRLAFRLFARAYQIEYVLGVDGPGWAALRDAVKVRDRLVHPRTAADLAVSQAEIELVVAAYEWFREALLSCLAALRTAMLGMIPESAVRSTGSSPA